LTPRLTPFFPPGLLPILRSHFFFFYAPVPFLPDLLIFSLKTFTRLPLFFFAREFVENSWDVDCGGEGLVSNGCFEGFTPVFLRVFLFFRFLLLAAAFPDAFLLLRNPGSTDLDVKVFLSPETFWGRVAGFVGEPELFLSPHLSFFLGA